MPWKEWEINDFRGMQTNVLPKDKNHATIVTNLTLTEKPGTPTLRPGYELKYEPPALFQGEEEKPLGFTTFVTDQPTEQEVFILLRKWSYKGKVGVNIWMRPYPDPETDIWVDDWLLLNPVFRGRIYKKDENIIPDPDKSTNRIGVSLDDISALNYWNSLERFTFEYGDIKTEVIVDSVSSIHNIALARCIDVTPGDEVWFHASYLTDETRIAHYEAQPWDISYHSIIGGLRIGFGGNKKHSVGLSITYRNDVLNIAGVNHSCGSISIDELLDFARRKGFMVDEYSAITRQGYGLIVSVIDKAENPLPKGLYKIRMTVLLDGFQEVMVKEINAIIEGDENSLSFIPYLVCGLYNKRVDVVRIYASIDSGLTYHKIGEDLIIRDSEESGGQFIINDLGNLEYKTDNYLAPGLVDLVKERSAVYYGALEENTLNGLSTHSVLTELQSRDSTMNNVGAFEAVLSAKLNPLFPIAIGTAGGIDFKSVPDTYDDIVVNAKFYIRALNTDSGYPVSETVTVRAFLRNSETGDKIELTPLSSPDILVKGESETPSFIELSFEKSTVDLGNWNDIMLLFEDFPLSTEVVIDDTHITASDGINSAEVAKNPGAGFENEGSDCNVYSYIYYKTESDVAAAVGSGSYNKNDSPEFVAVGECSKRFYTMNYFYGRISTMLDSSESAYRYNIRARGKVKYTGSDARIIHVETAIYKANDPTGEGAENSWFDNMISVELSPSNDEYEFEFTGAEVIKSINDLELHVITGPFNEEVELVVGEVYVKRQSAELSLDGSTKPGDDMEYLMGYYPTFDLVRDWKQSLAFNGRAHFLSPYIEKRYPNMLVKSVVSGAGAFMYDVAPAGVEYIEVGRFDGSQPVGMEVMPSSDLLILKENAVIVIDPDTGYARNIGSGKGCVSKSSVVRLSDGVIWCGEEDVYMISPSLALTERGLLGDSIRNLYHSIVNKQAIISTRDRYGNYIFRDALSIEPSPKEFVFEPGYGWVFREISNVSVMGYRIAVKTGLLLLIDNKGVIYIEKPGVDLNDVCKTNDASE